VLYESNAIVEYLDEAYASQGTRLYPGDARRRATVRRIVSEVDGYTSEATDALIEELLYVKPEARDAARLEKARAGVADEFAFLARYLEADFLAGPLSAADFRALSVRRVPGSLPPARPDVRRRSPAHPALAAWKRRIERCRTSARLTRHWRAA
jgi:glutathione S-transferase